LGERGDNYLEKTPFEAKFCGLSTTYCPGLYIPSLSSGQHKNVAFTSLKNAFAMCVSDAALTFFENSNEIAAVLEEAKETAKNYTFSSMVCMFALSTVIQCAIQ
jgi:hypothetical protein